MMTRYYQPTPKATVPFSPIADRNDPNFSVFCAGKSDSCNLAWGLRVLNSVSVLVYGAGLYSFFNNYSLGKSSFLWKSLQRTPQLTPNQSAPITPQPSTTNTARTKSSALIKVAERARHTQAAASSSMASTQSEPSAW